MALERPEDLRVNVVITFFDTKLVLLYQYGRSDLD